MKRSIAIRALQDGELREEQFQGRDHLVVPVVALVEGVLQGMNAEAPELALAEEFGKVPAGWNGRPLVMNHPIVDNTPVSANSPTVLETYCFGHIFNTHVEDSKLKCEAWIDLTRVSEMGGEIESTVQRLKDNVDVEISTGLYTDLEESEGRFNSRDYSGIWRNIVPDHLAFLSEGTLGACSIEDGCGANRVNAAKPVGWVNLTEAPKTHDHGDCGCGCGGGCKDTTMPKDNAAPILLDNSIPGDMLARDVVDLLDSALTKALSSEYFWVAGYTADHVIYYQYVNNGAGYFRREFSIGEDSQVTLSAEVEPVNLLTSVVPAKEPIINQEPEMTNTPKDPKANEADPKGAEAASDDTTTTATAETETAAPEAAATDPAPVANAAPKRLTLNQYLDEAPEELQDVLKSAMKLHADKKAELIKALKDTGRCKFSDQQLAGMNVENLEALNELAQVPDFSGRATPKSDEIVDNSVPAPIPLFPAKTEAA